MAGTVPETVLKKRKRDEEWANKKSAAAAEAQKKARSSRKDILKRAESYVHEYRNKVCIHESTSVGCSIAATYAPTCARHDNGSQQSAATQYLQPDTLFA